MKKLTRLPDPGESIGRCTPTLTDSRPGCGGLFCVESKTGRELDTEPNISEGHRGTSVLLRCNKCGRFDHARVGYINDGE